MHKKMNFIFIIIFICILCCIDSELFAKVCPECGASELPELIMLCPECGINLHGYAYQRKGTQRSPLIVRLFYTGSNPNKLSEYAKLFVNGKYMGNIELVEKQMRNEEGLNAWNNGLGSKFTALYEREFKNIPTGQLRIEIEMRFNRFYGYGRSYKRAVFPYVMFSGDKKTTIEHYFESAVDFSVTDRNKKEQLKKEKPIEIPLVSDTKIKTATGSIKLDIGLFD